jgi:hypothetical protein
MADETTTTLDAPSAGLDGLDAAISAMEQQFQAQTSPEPTQTPGDSPNGQQAAPQEQPAEQPAQEPGGSDTDDEDLESTSSDEPVKPTSRMGRLRQQLTQAEQKAREAEGRLTQRQQAEAYALQQFVNLVLPDAELEALRVKAENGDWEAKQRVDLARQWRQMVTPIADLAHQAARREFDQALNGMRTLDGMDGDTHQKLLAAQSPGDKLKLMWQLGKKLSDDSHKERIAELEQEVQALKTNRAANGTQPASGGSPKNGTPLGFGAAVGRDGLLTEEAERMTEREFAARYLGASV